MDYHANHLSNYLWIALGAVVGASARYSLSLLIARRFSTAFPYGTLLINITGSLILGFFLVWTSERVLADPRWRLFIAVGFCATYSTYSSFAFETFALFEKGQMALAALNILGTNVVCLIAVMLGAMLARSL